jgi:hypothetical protein
LHTPARTHPVGHEGAPIVPVPFAALAARARAEGYGGKGKGAPYHGYYYKILTRQGAAALARWTVDGGRPPVNSRLKKGDGFPSLA